MCACQLLRWEEIQLTLTAEFFERGDQVPSGVRAERAVDFFDELPRGRLLWAREGRSNDILHGVAGRKFQKNP